MDDAISRQAVLKLLSAMPPEEAMTKAMLSQSVKQMDAAQPEIIRCHDCDHWNPGFIDDNDNFIPPKCGKYQQMVGHFADDYCSYAERREVSE